MALSAVLFAALTFQSGTGDLSAEEALRRSLERTPSANVEAVVDQIAPWGPGTVRLRMWRDVSGRRRTEVLSPLDMQGQISVDDGSVWTTFFPDNKSIRSHPSPLLERDDLDFRMRLVRKNYRLEIDSKTTVAGRSAIRVVAKPKSADLETRRYYLDSATSAPLKTETTNELGNVTVLYLVRRIEFPSRFEKSMFVPLSGSHLDQPKPPMPVKSVDEAERRLGFRPAAPRWLPYGFRSQGMVLLEFREINPVATKLTDGLLRLNVLQFRIPQGSTPKSRPDERRSCRDVGNVRVEVRGDAPAAVREQIVAAYAKVLERTTKSRDSGAQETNHPR